MNDVYPVNFKRTVLTGRSQGRDPVITLIQQQVEERPLKEDVVA